MSKPWRLSLFEWANACTIRLLGAAPTDERCVMGSPISTRAWCRRRSLPDELWCPRHRPPAERCEHDVSVEDYCERCAHHPYEEWVGFPITACARCGTPWPCEYAASLSRDTTQ